MMHRVGLTVPAGRIERLVGEEQRPAVLPQQGVAPGVVERSQRAGPQPISSAIPAITGPQIAQYP
jgi:hypothetical protein